MASDHVRGTLQRPASRVRLALFVGVLFFVSASAAFAASKLFLPDVAFDRNLPPSTERVSRPKRPELDKAAYDAKMLAIANRPASVSAATVVRVAMMGAFTRCPPS